MTNQNKVAIYCRLSNEDRNKQIKTDESESIQNQKKILLEYALKQGWDIFNIYVDEDFSGSDRERPAFNQMISDAQSKKFNIILCKTQSRFARDIEVVEKYIHNLFILWGVRFISIVDNIDTSVVGNKKTRQINALVDEWYLENLSESIKSVIHAKQRQGQFIGAFAPFGYMKDPNNKNHLVIDEEAAEIVREIFRLYISGMSKIGISRHLNSLGVICPMSYKIQQGDNIGKRYNFPHKWSVSTINRILNNEIYIGNLIQGKTCNPTYKSKHTISVPKDEWIRVEHTHEPIISIEDWELVKNIQLLNTKPHVANGGFSMFSGKLKCEHCGYNMTPHIVKKKKYYSCYTNFFKKAECSGSHISEAILMSEVQSEFFRIKKELIDEYELSKSVNITSSKSNIDNLNQRKKNLQKEISDIDIYIRNIYVDKIKNIITEEQFVSLSAQFEEEKKLKQIAISQIEKEIENLGTEKLQYKNKVEWIKQFSDNMEFDRPTIIKLVDHITVSGKGETRRINIYWNF